MLELATPSGTSREPQSDGDVLSQVVRFLWRNRVIVSIFVLLGAALGLLWSLVLTPRVYTSTATLVAVGSAINSKLAPKQLPMRGYQTLLRSDAVVADTRSRLIEQGVLENEDFLTVGDQLGSEIDVSRRREEMSLSPMIRIWASADSSDRAATIANTWAEVFLEYIKRIMIDGTSAVVDFVQNEYVYNRDQLKAVENEWVKANQEFQAKRDAVADKWDQRIAASKEETSNLLSAHRIKTREAMEELLASHTREWQSQAATPDATKPAWLETLSSLATVRAQLADTSPLFALEKAITNDILWISLVIENANNTDVGSVRGRSLITEEINPAYPDLVLTAMELESELTRRRLEAGETALATPSFEKLQSQRAAELAKLKEKRGLELSVLRRKQLSELDSIDRERKMRLAEISRQLSQMRKLEDQLAANYNEAVLAKAQESVEQVLLGSRAVAANEPRSRRAPLKTLLCAILGGVFGLGLAKAREALAPVESQPE